MVMLTSASIFFSLVATAALLFVCDALFWRVLPVGFEALTVFGALAMMIGSASSLLSAVFAVITLRKHGGTRPRIALCSWSAILILAFASLMLR